MKRMEEPQVSDEGESGVRSPEKLADPSLPTKAERAGHSKRHLPFRSWFDQCIRGKGKEPQHHRQAEVFEVPEVQMDFMRIGEEEGGENLAVRMVKERSARMLAAIVVPRKSTGEYAAKRVVALMKETGCDPIRVGVKSDNELAVVDLVEQVGKVRASKVAQQVENSAANSTASNVVVEKGGSVGAGARQGASEPRGVGFGPEDPRRTSGVAMVGGTFGLCSERRGSGARWVTII